MKRKPSRLVYTNLGFDPRQHRLLKHVAVEEGKDMAVLVREAVDAYLKVRRRAGELAYENDFALFKLGRSWSAEEERPYRPGDWGRVDRDLYGS